MLKIQGTVSDTAYSLYGAEDAPCIVLIHGLGLTQDSTWGGMIPTLSQKYSLVSYDLLGHGRSEFPEHDIDLKALSEQLRQLLDDLSIEKATLVGFSLGGMINRRFALDHPDRVENLIILNSPHERGEEQQELVEARARDTRSGGPAANIDTTLARWFTKDFCRISPVVVQKIKQVVLANNALSYAVHRLVLAEGVKELIAPSPAIQQRTLVVTCENDSGSTPEMATAIAAEIAGSTLEIVPNLQHLGLIEQPEYFANLIVRFLEQKG